ncbi:MAG: phosphoribosylglycinamide formyltransferase [Hyphomicrobiaceae bacterium]|nr:phosphoribosylglycinamide formyltransferase [Hyphomicrobiaceae bacterium]
MTKKKRVAILISGRGSNMASLIEAARAPDYPAEIVLVASNRPEAAGLDRARAAGIPAVAIDHKAYATRMAFEAKLHTTLLDAGIDLICSAGFMRMLTGGFVDRWRNRQLNIHPSLLPSFPGLDTHARALSEGVKIHGCTVHFVRLEMDTGPIIAQAAVPVVAGETADSLAARVLEAEHVLYPHALRLVASGAVAVENDEIVTKAADLAAAQQRPPRPLVWPPVRIEARI